MHCCAVENSIVVPQKKYNSIPQKTALLSGKKLHRCAAENKQGQADDMADINILQEPADTNHA